MLHVTTDAIRSLSFGDWIAAAAFAVPLTLALLRQMHTAGKTGTEFRMRIERLEERADAAAKARAELDAQVDALQTETQRLELLEEVRQASERNEG